MSGHLVATSRVRARARQIVRALESRRILTRAGLAGLAMEQGLVHEIADGLFELGSGVRTAA